MGNLSSLIDDSSGDPFGDGKEPKEHFVIKFIKAVNPQGDNPGQTHCNPYLRCYLSVLSKASYNINDIGRHDKISVAVTTPTRSDSKVTTVWNSYRNFFMTPPPESYLTVEMMNAAVGDGGEMMGYIHIPIAEIMGGSVYGGNLVMNPGKLHSKKKEPIKLYLQRVFANEPPPRHKIFFLLRHGESKWNKAQADIRISGLLNKDHALTEVGLQQAMDLNRLWKLEMEKSKSINSSDSINEVDTSQPFRDWEKLASEAMRNAFIDDSGFRSSPSFSTASSSSPHFTPIASHDSKGSLSPPQSQTTNSLLDFDEFEFAPTSATYQQLHSGNTAATYVPFDPFSSFPTAPGTSLSSTHNHHPNSNLSTSHPGELLDTWPSAPSSSSLQPAKITPVPTLTQPSSSVKQPTAMRMSSYSAEEGVLESPSFPNDNAWGQPNGNNGGHLVSADSSDYEPRGAVYIPSDILDTDIASLATVVSDSGLSAHTANNSASSSSADNASRRRGLRLNAGSNSHQSHQPQPHNMSSLIEERKQELTQLFLEADGVITSPLTRAIETAIMSMEGHPAMALDGNGLTLFSQIREIKSIGGFDSIGMAFGPAAIENRFVSEMSSILGKPRVMEAMPSAIHYNDCNQPWWTGLSSYDSEVEQSERIKEFINFARYCEFRHPVFVGHSLFFKLFCSKRVSKLLATYRPELADNLRKYRLSNATVLAVHVLFSDDPEGDAVLLDADILFSGGFHVAHKGSKEDLDDDPDLPYSASVPAGGSSSSHNHNHNSSDHSTASASNGGGSGFFTLSSITGAASSSSSNHGTASATGEGGDGLGSDQGRASQFSRTFGHLDRLSVKDVIPSSMKDYLPDMKTEFNNIKKKYFGGFG